MLSRDERLANFRCVTGDRVCIMGLHNGLTDDYQIEGTKLVFRGQVLGDLEEKSIAELICYEHCHARYFDEVLGAPRPPRLRVKHPRKRVEEYGPDF